MRKNLPPNFQPHLVLGLAVVCYMPWTGKVIMKDGWTRSRTLLCHKVIFVKNGFKRMLCKSCFCLGDFSAVVISTWGIRKSYLHVRPSNDSTVTTLVTASVILMLILEIELWRILVAIIVHFSKPSASCYFNVFIQLKWLSNRYKINNSSGTSATYIQVVWLSSYLVSLICLIGLMIRTMASYLPFPSYRAHLRKLRNWPGNIGQIWAVY